MFCSISFLRPQKYAKLFLFHQVRYVRGSDRIATPPEASLGRGYERNKVRYA